MNFLNIIYINFIMPESVEEIQHQIKLKYELKKQTEIDIENLKNKLYQICPHEWVIDYSNYGEHTEYICKKCLSYKI